MEAAPKGNILIVDDHPENLLALEAILDSPSYNIIKAHSGEEALKQLLHHDFAVILLDVQMPGLDGFETARLIRERKRSRHTPIIFMSAIHKAHEHILQGHLAGGVDYLFTPYDPDILRSKVAAFVFLFTRNSWLTRQTGPAERERRGRYRRLSEAMPLVVWTARADGSIDHINKRWRTYTGMTFEQSKEWGWTKALHKDDLQVYLDRWNKSLRIGWGFNLKCRVKRKDGAYRWHLIQIAPETDRKGEISAWFGAAMDIHDQAPEAIPGEQMELSS